MTTCPWLDATRRRPHLIPVTRRRSATRYSNRSSTSWQRFCYVLVIPPGPKSQSPFVASSTVAVRSSLGRDNQPGALPLWTGRQHLQRGGAFETPYAGHHERNAYGTLSLHLPHSTVAFTYYDYVFDFYEQLVGPIDALLCEVMPQPLPWKLRTYCLVFFIPPYRSLHQQRAATLTRNSHCKNTRWFYAG